MLYGRNSTTSYENFETVCPHCGQENVFNRATDLEGATQIDFREVVCLNAECGGDFAINGDSADPCFAQVFFQAYKLMPRKQFGDAIVIIARAYEMFFEHFLSEWLVWKPFVATGYEDSDAANAASNQLATTIEKWPFRKMRNAFANVVIRPPVSSLAEGVRVISHLPKLIVAPKPQAVDSLPNPLVRRALQRLLASQVSGIRNSIIHKSGHRPTQAEASKLFDEARDVIWDLADELDVRYDSI